MESGHGILRHRMMTDLHHTPLAIVTILPATVSINCILSEVSTEAKEIVEHTIKQTLCVLCDVQPEVDDASFLFIDLYFGSSSRLCDRLHVITGTL
jgi:hypothetical protein